MRRTLNLHCHMCGGNIADTAMNFDGEPIDEVLEVFTVRPAMANGKYPIALLEDDKHIKTNDAKYMEQASFCSECASMYYTTAPATSIHRCGCCGDRILEDEPFFVISLTHTDDVDGSIYSDEVSETIEVREVVPRGKTSPDIYRCLECSQDMFDIEDEEDPYTSVYNLSDELGYFDMSDDD